MLSEVAKGAVRAAAACSPARAQTLLDILRTAPEAVKRKPGRYGPLAFVLLGKPLPVEQRHLFERFAEEWRRGDFGVAELADALEGALVELTQRPQDPDRHRAARWRTVAGRPHSPEALIRPSRRP